MLKLVEQARHFDEDLEVSDELSGGTLQVELTVEAGGVFRQSVTFTPTAALEQNANVASNSGTKESSKEDKHDRDTQSTQIESCISTDSAAMSKEQSANGQNANAAAVGSECYVLIDAEDHAVISAQETVSPVSEHKVEMPEHVSNVHEQISTANEDNKPRSCKRSDTEGSEEPSRPTKLVKLNIRPPKSSPSPEPPMEAPAEEAPNGPRRSVRVRGLEAEQARKQARWTRMNWDEPDQEWYEEFVKLARLK